MCAGLRSDGSNGYLTPVCRTCQESFRLMPDLKKANWENGFYWEGRNGYPLQPGLFDWECQKYIVVLSGNLIIQKQLVTQYNLMGSNGKPIRIYLVSSAGWV
jgi:hypothetical protein